MKNREYKHHADEVDKTLSALDDLESIEVGPYFFARLKARVESSDSPVPNTIFPSVITKLAPAFLVFVVLINLFTGVMVLWGGTRGVDSRDGETPYVTEPEYLSPGAPDPLDIISE